MSTNTLNISRREKNRLKKEREAADKQELCLINILYYAINLVLIISFFGCIYILTYERTYYIYAIILFIIYFQGIYYAGILDCAATLLSYGGYVLPRWLVRLCCCRHSLSSDSEM